MLHALAAMGRWQAYGIDYGSGHLLFGLSARTERNPLPIALSVALILPMFAYAALFFLFITDYGNFPVAKDANDWYWPWLFSLYVSACSYVCHQ